MIFDTLVSRGDRILLKTLQNMTINEVLTD